MRLVLLSGGSGKRLWPLSNDSRSKQFLKVLASSTNEYESMVQRVWRQLTTEGLQEHAVIATSKTQVDILYNQLGDDIRLAVEPERRDTFPAIALAATYLYSIEGADPSETVVVLPVDPYVDQTYFQTLRSLDDVLQKSGAELALMGVTPAYSSEKFGYIVPQLEIANGGYARVSCFREKPSEAVAEQLIHQGALWNCGVFAFPLRYMLDILKKNGHPLDYNELYQQYSTLPKTSFDYEVVEKSSHIVVVPYHGSWKDLGTWEVLTEEMSAPILGKGMMGEDTSNNNIINELDIPVAVLGLSDVIVAASPDGILVADKEASPRVKELITFDTRPMYVERRWGWYKILDYTKYGDEDEVLTKRVGINEGKSLSYHAHFKRSEIWTVLKGSGEFILNGELRRVSKDDVLVVPQGAKHAIRAVTDLELIEVQKGTELVETDVHRYVMDWDEILVMIGQAGR